MAGLCIVAGSILSLLWLSWAAVKTWLDGDARMDTWGDA